MLIGEMRVEYSLIGDCYYILQYKGQGIWEQLGRDYSKKGYAIRIMKQYMKKGVDKN